MKAYQVNISKHIDGSEETSSFTTIAAWVHNERQARAIIRFIFLEDYGEKGTAYFTGETKVITRVPDEVLRRKENLSVWSNEGSEDWEGAIRFDFPVYVKKACWSI